MRRLSVVLGLGLLVGTAAAAAPLPQPHFGQSLTSADLKDEVSIPPSGAGLPPGSGSVAQGQQVYANVCASCHGDKLQGIKATGAPALIGGRGTLTSAKPLKTVESYWPYATTVFDYVRRAMPFNAPGSLSDDQVYAVTAYVLAQGHVIQPDLVIDAKTLPRIRMPNVDGFESDPRPKQ